MRPRPLQTARARRGLPAAGEGLTRRLFSAANEEPLRPKELEPQAAGTPSPSRGWDSPLSDGRGPRAVKKFLEMAADPHFSPGRRSADAAASSIAPSRGQTVPASIPHLIAVYAAVLEHHQPAGPGPMIMRSWVEKDEGGFRGCGFKPAHQIQQGPTPRLNPGWRWARRPG